MKITLKTECKACSGTGLYVGFMEGKGQAVICVGCTGTGCREIEVKKYAGRKPRSGITKIRGGSGTILDDASNAKWYSYREFETKIPAPKADK